MNFRIDRFTVNSDSFEVWSNDKQLAAQPQVIELLVFLIEYRDRVVTRDEIFAQIWKNRVVSDTTLSSRIKSIRKLLGDDGVQQKFIRTIHGRGYRFIGDVSQTDAKARDSADKPSIAVLPFDSMNQDPEQTHFADGMVEEIITALSKFNRIA